MRVIAGTARSLPLQTPKGLDTRPTTDRIRETLFNMLSPCVPGCRFLDLFAGSGAIAVEALSRGAAWAVLVEKEAQALRCMRENLAFTRLNGRAEILGMDVMAALSYLEQKNTAPFDIIFMDPPYHKDWERQALTRLADSPLAKEDTWMIVEAALDTDFSRVREIGLDIRKEKKYKTNKHMWIRKEEI